MIPNAPAANTVWEILAANAPQMPNVATEKCAAAGHAKWELAASVRTVRRKFAVETNVAPAPPKTIADPLPSAAMANASSERAAMMRNAQQECASIPRATLVS